MRNGELASWLVEECERRNLSWAEASRRANISPNTISDIVNGASVGPKRLLALAEAFDTSPEHVYRMAGLLPPLPEGDVSPEARAMGRELLRIWRDVEEADPDAARELMRIAIVQAAAFRAAVNAAKTRVEENREA